MFMIVIVRCCVLHLVLFLCEWVVARIAGCAETVHGAAAVVQVDHYRCLDKLPVLYLPVIFCDGNVRRTQLVGCLP